MMMSHVPLFVGITVGLSIAVPVGPMALLCIQRTLSSGMRVGVCTGLGAGTVNLLYGALILVGLDRAGTMVASGGRVLSFVGGVFLLWSAARTTMRQRFVQPVRAASLSPAAAYGSAVVFNATNPLSPVLMVALLSPVVALNAPGLGEAASLLVGMLVAVVVWWVCLTGGVSLLRSRLSAGMLTVINRVAAALLSFYGILALLRSAGLS